MDTNELEARAMRAYFRVQGANADQPAKSDTVITRNRIRLGNVNGLLAEYKISGERLLRIR